MKAMRVIPIIAIWLLGVSGCATYPNEAEQKVRMSQEPFSDSYRIAVTSYQREADIDTAVMKTTLWTLMRQSSLNQALTKIATLDKIDTTVKDVVGRLLPAKTEILDRASYGAEFPITGINIVADDAMLLARDKGYQALLFVAVQPLLTTTDISGTGDFRVQLLGLYQLHKVLPSGEIGGNTVLLNGKEIANCPQVTDDNKPEQLHLTLDHCVDVLAEQLNETLTNRLK